MYVDENEKMQLFISIY